MVLGLIPNWGNGYFHFPSLVEKADSCLCEIKHLCLVLDLRTYNHISLGLHSNTCQLLYDDVIA